MNNQQKAFEQLITPVNDELGRYCYALTGNLDAAKDLIQQTLLITWENFEMIREPKAIKYYLFKTALQQFYKSKRRNKFTAEWNEETINQLSDGQISPEIQSDIRMLYESVNQLPEKYGDALLLYEISGFSVQEIAELKAVSKDAIKKRLTRGREQLKAIMQETPDKTKL